jgi:hypothetical protein
LGLNLDRVLTEAIDRDTQFGASTHALDRPEIPNLKVFLNALHHNIEHLVDRSELATAARQSTLIQILSDLQQF